MKKIKKIKWTDQEKNELSRIVGSSWDGVFEGYSWVADKLNNQFNNNRSVASIVSMCKKLGV